VASELLKARGGSKTGELSPESATDQQKASTNDKTPTPTSGKERRYYESMQQEALNHVKGAYEPNNVTSFQIFAESAEHGAASQIINLWKAKNTENDAIRRGIIEETRRKMLDPQKYANQTEKEVKEALLQIKKVVHKLPVDATCMDGKTCPFGMCCGKSGLCGTGPVFCSKTKCASQCAYDAAITKVIVCARSKTVPKRINSSQKHLNAMVSVHNRLILRSERAIHSLAKNIEKTAEELQFLEMLIRTNIGVTIQRQEAKGSMSGGSLTQEELSKMAQEIQRDMLNKVSYMKVNLESGHVDRMAGPRPQDQQVDPLRTDADSLYHEDL